MAERRGWVGVAPTLAALLAVAMAPGCACSPFGVTLAEFDSVAGWRPGRGEPDLVEYSEQVERLSLPLRLLAASGLDLAGLLAIEPGPTTESNPVGFARARMGCLVDGAGDDVGRLSLAAVRLTWVLDGDDQPLNQMVATHQLGRVMRALDAHVLADLSASNARRGDLESVRAWHPRIAVLRRVVDDLAQGEVPRDAALEARQALAEAAQLQAPTPRDARGFVLLLNFLARYGTGELRLQAAAAQHEAVVALCRDTLQRAVVEPRSPLVREAAIRACCACDGTEAIPRILAIITAPRREPGTLRSLNRYDQDPRVRMALVRLCGQLPPGQVVRGYGDGPPPVEFLYDMVVDDSSEPGLRAAALASMSLALGKPMQLQREWADEWYADFVANRGAEAGR